MGIEASKMSFSYDFSTGNIWEEKGSLTFHSFQWFQPVSASFSRVSASGKPEI
jgi:hypothetical protein